MTDDLVKQARGTLDPEDFPRRRWMMRAVWAWLTDWPSWRVAVVATAPFLVVVTAIDTLTWWHEVALIATAFWWRFASREKEGATP